jgi:lipoprotein-anchoring transpeptidase ErfK/SrfK
MILRIATALTGFTIGFAAFGEAAAQYYPADRSPPGGYQVVPPDNDDDLVDAPRAPRNLSPDASRMPEPYPRRPQSSLYPPEPIPEPYERRYDERAVRPAPYGQPRQPYAERAPLDPPYDVRPGDDRPGALRPPTEVSPRRGPATAALPPDYEAEANPPKELGPQFRRQLVDYPSREPAGTLIIDTANTYLYLVMGDGTAIRYGIGVGREGFTWTGRERISRMAEWPDWHPPAEMIERQPYLPRFMAGGEGNPLGARALYLGKTLYRIHGTNQPSTIGTFVSSGCVRLLNDDIEDLYQRVTVGTQVVVLPGKPPQSASAQ